MITKRNSPAEKSALLIIDMQRTYLDPSSDSNHISKEKYPNAKDYILDNGNNVVVPNIRRILEHFRNNNSLVIFIRLCGTHPEREDLHRNLRDAWRDGVKQGFHNICPVESDPMSQILEALAPRAGERVLNKTSYSPFTSTDINTHLKNAGITTVVLTGLITSQCVETTARDASDYGYEIVQVEDAMTDYDQDYHDRSLKSSQGVCGGAVLSTENYLRAQQIPPKP